MAARGILYLSEVPEQCTELDLGLEYFEIHMNETDILIKINGKVHRIIKGDTQAIKKMPWKDRKQLVELLEEIKQAEFIKPKNTDGTSSDASLEPSSSVSDIPSNKSRDTATKISQSTIDSIHSTDSKHKPQKLDPQVKSSEKDVDDLMARLILEQKQNNHHQSVPDKSSVIKLLLIVFVIIIALAVIF